MEKKSRFLTLIKKPSRETKPLLSLHKNLLMKFSNCGALLPYYGQFQYWERMMRRLNKKSRQTWDSNENAFINLASICNFDVEKMNLNDPPKYHNSPEHLSYIIDVKSKEEGKALNDLLLDYARNKTFIGIYQIKLIYTTKKNEQYYKHYYCILKLCKRIGINKNVLRTIRFDQYEQQEFMQYVLNKIGNIPKIDYFYSIDMPNSNSIVFDEKTETFQNKYTSVVTTDRNMSCHMISIAIEDIEFVLTFIAKINKYLLYRTEVLQILFNSSHGPDLAIVKQMIDQLTDPFNNIKAVNINVFDRFGILQKMLDLNLDKPKNIELYNIKDLDKLSDFEVNLKCIDGYFYVATSFQKVRKYTGSYFDLTFYSFNLAYCDNGLLVLRNFYNCKIKGYEKCDEMNSSHYVQDIIEEFNSQECAKENIMLVIPLNEWKNGKIGFNKLTYTREEFGKKLMNSINLNTKLMVDHRSVFKV